MNDTAIATPEQQLALFRSTHRIQVTDDGERRTCAVDGIRIHPVRGGWRHDTSEVVALISHVAHREYDLFDAECRACYEPRLAEAAR